MTAGEQILTDLHEHLAQCRAALALAETECERLRDGKSDFPAESAEARRNLLPKLEASVISLRSHRQTWRQIDPAIRAQFPEVTAVIRQLQDVIMRILVLDRQNEQALLRLGMIPPRSLASVSAKPAQEVANLYRRSGPPPSTGI